MAPGVLVLHGCEGYQNRYGQLADARPLGYNAAAGE
jgi:hypothetical protein